MSRGPDIAKSSFDLARHNQVYAFDHGTGCAQRRL
jgi:hypothetical protein